MKKQVVILLALVISACNAGMSSPSQTPVVAETSTEFSTSPTLVFVTATQGPAETATSPAPAPTDTHAPVPTSTLSLESDGVVFSSITRSGSAISVNCAPPELTFNITSANSYVAEIDFYYRMESKDSATKSDWLNGGPIESDGKGNFRLILTPSKISPSVRYTNAWLDYQFVALNKYNNVIERSDKFVHQVTFAQGCP